MDAFLYNLGKFLYYLFEIMGQEWFPYALAAWLALAILYDFARGWKFFGSLALLWRQPVIFEHCQSADSTVMMEGGEYNLPFYPRTFLEQISCAVKSFVAWPFRRFVVPLVNSIAQKIYPFTERGVHDTFVSLLFGVFLTMFGYGDSIAIANGLDALGLIRGSVPPILLYYEFAVAVASFLAIVVGFFELFGSFARQSDSDAGALQVLKIRRFLSLIVVLLGVTTATFLGIGRIMALGYWSESEFLRVVVQFSINVLTLVNGLLAAALVFDEGIEGYRVLAAILAWGVSGGLLVVDVITFVVGHSVMFTVDVLWRVVYTLVGLPLYFIVAPLLAVISSIVGIIVGLVSAVTKMFQAVEPLPKPQAQVPEGEEKEEEEALE